MVVDEVGVVVSEVKSVGFVLVVVVVGAGVVGCVVFVFVVVRVVGVNGNSVSVVGWVEFVIELILKSEVSVWDVFLLVNENFSGVVDGAVEVVVVESNIKSLGVVFWLEVTVFEMVLVRVLLFSSKSSGCVAVGVVVALFKLSFGVLIFKEKSDFFAVGVVVLKLNFVVCVVGVWVVSEKRLVVGVFVVGWVGVLKLNSLLLDVEKENLVVGVVVVVFVVLNVNSFVGVLVFSKLNSFMVLDLVVVVILVFRVNSLTFVILERFLK